MELSNLKETVTVSEDPHALILEYGISKISIPKGSKYSTLLEALWNRKPININSGLKKDELKIVTLLVNQGYLAYEIGDELSLKEAKQIFDSIRIRWYREYYHHTVWEQLRKGQLNENGLLGWLIHNYHVSRSAGMTDARFFSRTNNLKLKEAYKESCLEEYSHCDEFYFVEHPNLNVSDADVRNYIHLPGSLAFDQQMLRMSEDCWLGHVFISYFQEATASFYDDCRPFYDTVEKAYGIDNFFNRWKQHVQLDLDYGHCEHFESIFSEDEIITRAFFEKALTHAWITYKHLYYALDQIIEEAEKSREIFLRNPVTDLTFDPLQTSLLTGYPAIDFKDCNNLAEIFLKLRANGLFYAATCNLSEKDKDFFNNDTRNLVMKTLGYSRSHYSTVMLGNFIRDNGLDIREADVCSSPDLMAVSNFLNELTYRPDNFIFCLGCLLESSLGDALKLTGNSKELLLEYLQRIPVTNNDVLNEFLQLNELISRAANTKDVFLAEQELN